MKQFDIGHSFPKPIEIPKESKSVSHNHATIYIDDYGTWTLVDNNSSNGTYIEANGQFIGCSRKIITPDTWIRLGNKGIAGYYFKARRVLSPNDYHEDFYHLQEQYREFLAVKEKIESRRNALKYITPLLSGIFLALSFLPVIGNNFMAIRAVMILPAIFSPIVQGILLNASLKKQKELGKKLICPKCRRTLTDYDIENAYHAYCKAK